MRTDILFTNAYHVSADRHEQITICAHTVQNNDGRVRLARRQRFDCRVPLDLAKLAGHRLPAARVQREKPLAGQGFPRNGS